MKLGKNFIPITEFEKVSTLGRYRLLPFRFLHLDNSRTRYVLTNMVGEHHVVSREQLFQIAKHELDPISDLYYDLKAKHIIEDDDSEVATSLLALKQRTKLQHLSNFTSLHIFVVTLRCDYSCPYCQVSRQTADKNAFDMTPEIARRAIDLVFESPTPIAKIEFQGGESLLNFELIKFIVELSIEKNKDHRKELEFVIATNLSFLNDEILDYCLTHGIQLSTSLDGPEHLHNANRPRPGKDGFRKTVAGIRLAQKHLGRHRVSALMTTTEASLSQPRAIIDEYIALGFSGIFLRSVSPYGFAVKTRQAEKYDSQRWLKFYEEAMEYILELNHDGLDFREFYSSLILGKLLTPFGSGFVDLQSPAGIGISAVVYNYDGDVYASDESRMLAEMGDRTFRLGNVFEDSYETVFGNDFFLDALQSSYADSVPLCSNCALNPLCGADPVYHHATQGDVVGIKATSGFCTKNMGISRYLISKMEDDPFAADLFRKWAWGC